MRTLLLALCLACACSSSHDPDKETGGSGGSGGGSSSGEGESGNDGNGDGDRDSATASGGNTASDGASDGSSSSPPPPLTSGEVFDLCDEFCSAIDSCDGQQYSDCISECTRQGDNDRSAECDDRVRQALQCLGDLDCTYLESQTGELDLRPTPCAHFLDGITGDCGG